MQMFCNNLLLKKNIDKRLGLIARERNNMYNVNKRECRFLLMLLTYVVIISGM